MTEAEILLANEAARDPSTWQPRTRRGRFAVQRRRKDSPRYDMDAWRERRRQYLLEVGRDEPKIGTSVPLIYIVRHGTLGPGGN